VKKSCISNEKKEKFSINPTDEKAAYWGGAGYEI
jgi:hypothetical protein